MSITVRWTEVTRRPPMVVIDRVVLEPMAVRGDALSVEIRTPPGS